MDISESLGAVFEQMEKFFRTETVIGKPIEAGEVTIVPIISVSFGAGKAGGESKNAEGAGGGGGGAGAGGHITPTAIIVIRGSEVEVMSLAGKGSLEKIINQIPELVAKAKNAVGKKDEAQEPAGQ